MRRWITLCACILALLAMPFAVTAAVIGDENATATPMGETEQMDDPAENMTIAAYIAQDENLTRLAEAINVSGLYDTLDTGGPYTVFAPSNEAFDALGNDTVNQLMNETDNLTMVLQYHVVEGEYTAENLTNMTENQTEEQNEEENNNGLFGGIFNGLLGNDEEEEDENMTTLMTLAGEELNVSVTNGEVMIENATVTMADINTTNGVIHIIDQVLVPPGVNLTATEETPAEEQETPAQDENDTGLVGVVQ